MAVVQREIVSSVSDMSSDEGNKKKEKGSARIRGLAPCLKSESPSGSLSDGLVLLAGASLIDLEASERFRILRAQLERKALGRGPLDVLAVTSAVPGEGKSVVAVNLARAFGIDPQGRSLIIDCDLRKPTVHRFFGEKLSPGLSDLLILGNSVESVVRTVEPGLDLITAGSPVIDSTRTLEQPGMELFLSELKKRYRRIVLDCPPVLLCSEPIALTSLASAALLVARAWRTQKKLVKEAVNVIGKKKIIGLTLNECNDSLKQYGYYSYYGYNKEAVARAKLKRAAAAKLGEPSSKDEGK
jgi:non-specific protein-tyrosine kinase